MTYVYQSEEGETLEYQCPISDTAPAVISADGRVYRRVFTAPAVIYRGSGFYTTDSADRITAWQRENLARD